MEIQEKILKILRAQGPLLPVQISKEIGTNILLASAMLSELSADNRVNISYVKVGGSPLYYMSGQENKLQEYYKHLHEKEKKAYNLLKEKKVLQDKELDPLSRVALRKLKDFAKPLYVNINDSQELFWKWFLVPKEDTEMKIRALIGLPEEHNKEKEKKSKTEEASIKQTQTHKRVFKQEYHKKGSEKENVLRPKQETLSPIKENSEVQSEAHSEFISRINSYFKKNNINVVDKNIIRKKSDIEFIIELPSSVGSLTYFCKAKNKKKSNEGDLSSAYMRGQSKNLPSLYLTTGDITKKALETAEKEFKGLSIKIIR